MSTQVIRVEADVADGDLRLMGMDGRIRLRDAVTLQHIEQGGLSCVVQAEEHDVRVLLEEA
jgi:hypothetical protein